MHRDSRHLHWPEDSCHGQLANCNPYRQTPRMRTYLYLHEFKAAVVSATAACSPWNAGFCMQKEHPLRMRCTANSAVHVQQPAEAQDLQYLKLEVSQLYSTVSRSLSVLCPLGGVVPRCTRTTWKWCHEPAAVGHCASSCDLQIQRPHQMFGGADSFILFLRESSSYMWVQSPS
jgi:hypothetical protein